MQNDLEEQTPYLRPANGARLLGMGESTLWARAKNDPTFPKPVKLAPRTTVFRRAELLAWAESRATEKVAA